jgi:hypothetical protein
VRLNSATWGRSLCLRNLRGGGPWRGADSAGNRDARSNVAGNRSGDVGCVVADPIVCIENLIRFDCVAESHNVSANGRADIVLAERACLALQVEEPA